MELQQVTKSVNSVRKSWKTTLMGILQFVAIASKELVSFLDTNPETVPDWGLLIASITTLIGLLIARDSDVSSKESGL